MESNVDPEQDRADLVIWLKAYDLQQLHGTLVEFGYDKLSLCTLLDEATLEDLAIPNRAHRETLLTAVNDLRQQDLDVDEYDDGWSSQEEDTAEPEQDTVEVNGEDDAGAMLSTARFLSGLDSGKLEESYRASFIADEPEALEAEEAEEDFPLPPPPPMISSEQAGPQYSEIPIPPPPPPETGEGDENQELQKTTSSFLASLSSSFGSYLGNDDFGNEDADGPPVAPKPKARVSPRPSLRSANSALPPVPTESRPEAVPAPGFKPAVAPRRSIKSGSSDNDQGSLSPPSGTTTSPPVAPSPRPNPKPPATAKSLAAPPAPTVSAAHDLYASVNKPTSPPPGMDLPPVQPAAAAPAPIAPKPKPTSKPKPAKQVSIVEPPKPAVEKTPSGSSKLDPKDRRSLVDIQGGDVDLDALLADLLEMESSVGGGSSANGSPSKSATAYAPPPAPKAAPLDEDEFTRLMAEMDLMGTGASRSSQIADRKSTADLVGEISKLSGGSKVLGPVPDVELSTSVLASSSLNLRNQHLSVGSSTLIDDDLEALSRDLDTGTHRASARLSGSFVSSMFGGDAQRPSDSPSFGSEPPSSPRAALAPTSVSTAPRPSVTSMGSTLPRSTPSPAGPGFNDIREVQNTAIVKLPDRSEGATPENRLERELAQLESSQMEGSSEAERKSRIEAVKVQIAVEKLKEAKVKKVVLKAYNADKSSKMIVVDDKMPAREICMRLMKKNRVQPGPNYLLIEQLTELYLERRLEDRELVVPVLDSWPRESNNSIVFISKPDKYMMLKRPQLFMPPTHAYAPGQRTAVLESTKRDIILKELFVAQTLPEVEGFLHVKEGRKGNWKKLYFSLRKSGLYFSTKGKGLMKDLHRMSEWKDIDVYTPISSVYHKRFRAPTDHCFALKVVGPLDITERKMRHFAVDSKQEQNAWVQGIRLAKLGNKLLEDYEKTYQQMPWLSRETEEEIDGIIQCQEAQNIGEDEDKRNRTGTLGKLRKSTMTKKPHDHLAADVAARSDAIGNRSPGHSRPLSTTSMDSADGGEQTSWQKQFGRAWKDAAEAGSPEIQQISLDELPPTPRTTATPYTSEFAPGEEEGMFNVRLF